MVIDFLDSPDGLGDGYRVDARIVIWQCGDVVRVPVSALFRSGDAWNVFSVEQGRAVRHLVEIDHRNSVEAEVRRGVAPGTELILHPSSELKEGMRVAKR